MIDDLLLLKKGLIDRTAKTFFHKHWYICHRYKIELDDLLQVSRIAFWEVYRSIQNDPQLEVLIDRYATRKMKFRMFDYLTMSRKYALRNGNEPVYLETMHI